ncbi:5-deoxy-glucuronate isomerase [Georgenia wangjunii]|uniref:5-deoxy-glucuronate isomerase n=1 Tax=Georgenia wangjunii TaxID=3117730 RepID=UPI002F26D781
MNEHLVRAGETAHGRWAVDVTPERAGWRYCGLGVLDLEPGGQEVVRTGGDELLVLPLAGGCTVLVDGTEHVLTGRADVFSAVTDHLYVPAGSDVVITADDGARLALPRARAARRLPASYRGADEVCTELRGAGACSRQVNSYALGNALATDHLLVCEVLTPGGNWSSYPPHKHDEHTADERELEEIYYFDVRGGPDGPGFAFHRTYGTVERPIELAAEVRPGDVVLTPHGYHGPSMAAPGYDLYYLNVMAGPAADRAWLTTDDPAHHWVRATWECTAVDPRLPMTVPTGRPATGISEPSGAEP